MANNNLISYQVEPYDDCIAEIDAILPDHWQEIALNKDSVQLDKDEESYRILADNDQLHIVTVRKSGELVGYIAGIIKTHLHYKSTLHCFTDVFYLKPECRKGMIGVKLFQVYQKTLKARGVKKAFIASKCHLDMSKLFDRFGWHRTEVVYTFLP
jgi:N-acetylglutamate synthase-like GNAT family acetyltransferase